MCFIRRKSGLVNAVDQVVAGKETQSITEVMQATEIAAAILTMSNDLGP